MEDIDGFVESEILTVDHFLEPFSSDGTSSLDVAEADNMRFFLPCLDSVINDKHIYKKIIKHYGY